MLPPWEETMLAATVSRGKKRGTRLLPIASKTTATRPAWETGPYIPVSDYRDISSYLANGYSLHMSDRAESQTPTLISPESIRGWSRTSKDFSLSLAEDSLLARSHSFFTSWTFPLAGKIAIRTRTPTSLVLPATRHFERSRPIFSFAFAPANASACRRREISLLLLSTPLIRILCHTSFCL